MAPPANSVHVVRGEAAMVVSCMRRNARWAPGSAEEQDPLLRNFSTLKQTLSSVKCLSEVPVNTFLNPFLEVVRSEVTTGPITGIALSAVNKFLAYGLIDPASPAAANGIENIADAVTHAKFIGTDLRSDEVVLMNILQVLRTLLLSPVSVCITNESVCELMHSCFRVCFEMRLSELLRRAAEQTLMDMIHHLFSRLGDLSELSGADAVVGTVSPQRMSVLDRSALDDSLDMAGGPGEPSSALGNTGESDPSDLEASRTNARGVRFTQKQEISDSALVPYGVPCIVELLKLLLSLINPRNSHNTDAMVSMGLSLLTIALETGGETISKFDSLMALVGDSMCYNLFGLLRSTNLTLFAAALRVIFLLFEAQRANLKFQLGAFLSIVMELEYPSFEHREGALDAILQLCRIPSFVTDVYLNFDCNLYCEELFERLVKFLSQNAFPEDSGLFTTNVIALEALLAIMGEMNSRPGWQPPSPSRPTGQDEAAQVGAGDAAETGGLPDAASIPRLKEQKRLLLESVEAFNEKPKKGIKFLQEHGLIGSDPIVPHEVAAFLRNNPSLDKGAIGAYLGEKHNLAVLEAFVKMFDFNNTTLDEGLRALLSSFRLPGEAQIIERIVETYANHWLHCEGGDEVVKDADAAFILSFAIILLNSDQHNPKNKKPMTLKDFLRNQRNLNGGEDFPEAFLESIFNNIHNREIIMPAEQEGDVKEEYEWGVMLERAKNPSAASFVSCEACSAYDQNIFLQVWGPTVAALSYVFDTATNEAVVQRATAGFRWCAELCARFGLCDVFDNLVVALCKRTGLGSRQGVEHASNGPALDSASARFGGSKMAQLAASTVFSLVHEHGNILREGWKDLLHLVRHLLLARLLPESMMRLQCFVTEGGAAPLWPVRRLKVATSEASLFSTFTGLFSSAEPTIDEDGTVEGAEPSARDAALACVDSCEVRRLFDDSKMLQTEALQDLIKAIMTLGSLPENAAEYHEEATIFFLELLCDVTLKNKDRIAILWQPVSQHFVAVLSGGVGHRRLLERGTVCLLRAGSRLLHKEEVAMQVLGSLSTLLRLPADLERGAAVQIAAGVRQLVEKEWMEIGRLDGWGVVLGLLQRATACEECLADAVSTLVCLVSEIKAIDFENFQAVLNLSLATASVLASGPVPRPSVSAEDAVSALGALSELHALVLSVGGGDPSVGDEAGSQHWAAAWQPLLQALASLCNSADRSVRQAALTSLQRSLLLPDLEQMQPVEWKACMDNVLFPLLNRLLEAGQIPAGAAEETRMRACTLLCKVFLQHLGALLSLEEFTGLWLRVLDYMDKYMHAGQSELLLEAIPESLKNMLLVMSTAGIFRPPNAAASHGHNASTAPLYPSHQSPRVLWDLTWNRIESFLPDLHNELFPDVELTHDAAEADAPHANGQPQPTERAPASERGATNASADGVVPKSTGSSVHQVSSPTTSPGRVGSEPLPSSPLPTSPVIPRSVPVPAYGGSSTPGQDEGVALPTLQFSSTPAPVSRDKDGLNSSVVLSPIPLSVDAVTGPGLSAMPDDLAAAVMGDSITASPAPTSPRPANRAGETPEPRQEGQETDENGAPIHHLPIIV